MNNNINKYNNIIYIIIRNNKKGIQTDLKNYNIDLDDFKLYFIKNVKRSTMLAQTLPCILFFILSLLGTMFLVLKYKSEFFISAMLLTVLFIMLFIALLIKKYLLKIKSVRLKKGYYNISNDIFKIIN